ncbi:MAG: hypothetical protein A3I26_01015 [Candidatus Yanofskybacteria bacterium RIFCSPLOWO2_02_FULL_43_10]|nr:MAG: hypothetical protein A3C69_02070 [Candidatus Yanofskybacteria bacterium RIFCSPHIGHO2_02_FULL_43_12]OGN30364.1 MAG: hypothetical protein A3I26_01015 [Candidatus Yanofskybacteria bacterium RIFCSPLOWO2_02_FULL_43_10]
MPPAQQYSITIFAVKHCPKISVDIPIAINKFLETSFIAHKHTGLFQEKELQKVLKRKSWAK